MTKTNDGGPAFPIQTDERLIEGYGMSLRDYFAAKAMQAIMRDIKVVMHGSVDFNQRPGEYIASAAYQMADAMLAEREKGGER